MKLRNILGLMLATAALSACGGNKDGKSGVVDGAVEMAPPAAESISPELGEAGIIPPSAEPSPEGAIGSMKDKAGEMMKEGAEEVIDAAKEAITN